MQIASYERAMDAIAQAVPEDQMFDFVRVFSWGVEILADHGIVFAELERHSPEFVEHCEPRQRIPAREMPELTKTE